MSVEDWDWAMRDDVIVNRSYLKKFGIIFAEVTILMQKQWPASAPQKLHKLSMREYLSEFSNTINMAHSSVAKQGTRGGEIFYVNGQLPRIDSTRRWHDRMQASSSRPERRTRVAWTWRHNWTTCMANLNRWDWTSTLDHAGTIAFIGQEKSRWSLWLQRLILLFGVEGGTRPTFNPMSLKCLANLC